VIVSTPCKILLFVLVDGWHLVARALSLSFD
jgi:flagellar biosynthetic protein FliP